MPDQEALAEATEDTSATEAVASPGDESVEAHRTGTGQTTKQTTGKENLVPQSRVNEIVAEKNTYREEVEALRRQIEAQREQSQKLVNLLDQQKDDVSLVANLRSLAATSDDQKVLDAIDLLDARMRGDSDAVQEVADQKVESGALTEAQARKMVAEQTAKLQDSIDAQKAELLFNQANTKAERMLSGLPEEFLDEDKKVISEAWLNRVDWDSMEIDPSRMDDLLATSLQATIDWYGTPRGAMRIPEALPVDEDGEPVPAEKTPEDEIAELNAIDWGAMKDGKPVYSDEEFTRAATKLAKLTSRS